MRKLRIFFTVLFRSATSPTYYKDVLKARASFSLKYLALLLFLLSFITTAKALVWFTSVTPYITRFKEQLVDQAAGLYPKELVVTVKDGTVKTNVKEPYVIDLPVMVTGNERGVEHFLTIDTKAQPATFADYKSWVVVGKDAIYYQDSKGYKFFPLTEVKQEIVIDKAAYDSLLAQALPYLQKAPTVIRWLEVGVVLVLPFILTLGNLVAKLVYLLLVTLVVLVIAKLMKKSVAYSGLYRLGMHGLTVPLLVSLVAGVVGLRIPLLFTLVFVVWMGVVVSRLASAKRTRR